MGALVEHQFLKGCVLDEERLRKIHSIISQRIASLEGNPIPRYIVHRSDSYRYDTFNIEDIIDEENYNFKKIENIAIVLAFNVDLHDNDNRRLNKDLYLELDFSPVALYLRIDGVDRDLVFLISSELKQYISAEVAILPRFPQFLLQIMPLLATLLLCLFGLTAFITIQTNLNNISNDQTYPTFLEEAMNLSMEEKIDLLLIKEFNLSNNLLMNRASIVTVAAIALGAIAAILFFGSKLDEKLIDFFFPKCFFLFGKQINSYARRNTIKNNLFWGVGVAFLVGIVGSLVVWWITK